MAQIERIEAKADEWVAVAVDWIAKKVNEFVASEGVCLLGLSGGGTPLPVYEALGKRTDVQWDKVKLWMVDDRHVPDTHKDSNVAAVQRTLFAGGLIPTANVFFPKVNSPYAECLEDYDKVMKDLIASSPSKRVHLSILGLGPDAHFASLFPNSPAELWTAAFDESKFVMGTTTDVFAIHDRITTTYPVLVNAAHSVFLCRGQDKVDVFESTVSSSETHNRYPAKPVVQKSPTTVIFDR